MGGITSAITTLQSELLTIVVPIAVVSVILWFVANALAPVLPEWAQSMRGHFQKVMLGVMLVGGATTIITAFYGMQVNRHTEPFTVTTNSPSLKPMIRSPRIART